MRENTESLSLSSCCGFRRTLLSMRGKLARSVPATTGRGKETTSHWHSWLCALTAALLVGCSGAPEKKEAAGDIVFPSPPEEPRFVFEVSLMNSAQITAEVEKSRLKSWLTGEVDSGEVMAKPFDVSVCRGTVFVSDTVRRVVLAYDFPNRRYYKVGEEEPGALLKPLGLAHDLQCNLYVADGSSQKVMVYDADGKYRTSLGGGEWFKHLSHVATSADGSRVYVVDTGGVDNMNHRVRVFDSATGGHLLDIGTRGSEPGQLNLPRDIALAPDGNLYVVDGGNFRVQVFTPDGKFVRKFGGMGAQFGQFSRPKGIAVDGTGNVYVADAAFGNFQIFDAQGQLLLFVGGRATTNAPAKYALPAGIHVDEDGRVYFVDQFFRKVDIYRPAGLKREQGVLGSGKSPLRQEP